LMGKHEQAERGLVLMPRRWVVEQSLALAWMARCQGLVNDFRAVTKGADGTACRDVQHGVVESFGSESGAADKCVTLGSQRC
jgi:hypothetical protein